MLYIYIIIRKKKKEKHIILYLSTTSTANFTKHALSVVKLLYMYVCEIKHKESMQLNGIHFEQSKKEEKINLP